MSDAANTKKSLLNYGVKEDYKMCRNLIKRFLKKCMEVDAIHDSISFTNVCSCLDTVSDIQFESMSKAIKTNCSMHEVVVFCLHHLHSLLFNNDGTLKSKFIQESDNFLSNYIYNLYRTDLNILQSESKRKPSNKYVKAVPKDYVIHIRHA